MPPRTAWLPLAALALLCGGCSSYGRVTAAGDETTRCAPGLTDCTSACADLQTSNAHCGACGNACASDTQCLDGVCTASAGCVHECESGTDECTEDGTRHCGQYDDDPCVEWSTATACAAPTTCDPGTGLCVAGCTSECAPLAQDCTDGGVSRCGQYDDDPCLEWSPAQDCAPGETCYDDKTGCEPTCADECTAGSHECSGSGSRECGQYDDDPCLEWSPVTPCDAISTCAPATGVCAPWCGSDCDPFSIVVLPDTQYYTDQANNSDNFYWRQTQWIVTRNTTPPIKFVIHLGDITDANKTSEWTVAKSAHGKLDTAGIPYSVVTGNHDYLPSATWSRTQTKIDSTFPASHFGSKPWYGGTFAGTSNANNYTFFDVGPMHFMVVSLEFAPRSATLTAAGALIDAHPDRRVIVVTHCYLTSGGGYATCKANNGATVGANGIDVWNKLIAPRRNIFMVIAGHVNGAFHRSKARTGLPPVEEMLVDYQFESSGKCDSSYAVGKGNGWLRQLTFYPLKGQVEAKTYSACGSTKFYCTGNYLASPTASNHVFSFPYDLSKP